MWGVRITTAGEEWLADRDRGTGGALSPAPDFPPAEDVPPDLPAQDCSDPGGSLEA